MYRRVNVSLPEETVQLIDTVAVKGERSRLVDRAIRRYVADLRRDELRRHVAEGAVVRAERDRRLAEEWSLIEAEVWSTRDE